VPAPSFHPNFVSGLSIETWSLRLPLLQAINVRKINVKNKNGFFTIEVFKNSFENYLKGAVPIDQ